MHLRRGNNVVVNVLLIALIIAGAGLVYYVIQVNSATPATITPHLSQIGAGQTAAITVSWLGNGGGVPYTVYLYQGTSSSSCGTSNTLAAAKTGLPTPGYTFNVNPQTTSYYCGTVAGAKGSSAVSAIAVVTVNPALAAPTLVLSPAAIDPGQSVTITATVKWASSIAPYTVTLYTGSNSTCSFDTTKASVLSGSNPLSSLTGTSATFSVKDPVTTVYYCATVTDGATVPHTMTSLPTTFTINLALSAEISPDYPIVDSGQSVTLTAVPAHGSSPYSYQWYNGSTCSSGAQLTGKTSSTLSTGPLTSTPMYSVRVTDSSIGNPPASVCASVIGAVSPPFTGTSVAFSSPSVVLDAGQSRVIVLTWNLVGTLPYTGQLYSSPTSDCQKLIAVGSPHVTSRAFVNFTISPTSTTYYCVVVTDGAIVPESASPSAGLLVTVNPALIPTFSLSPLVIDAGQTATLTARVAWTGGTSPYSVTLFSGTNPNCASDTTPVAVLSGTNPRTGITGKSANFTFTAPTASTEYCASITDKATTPVTLLVPVPPKLNTPAPAVQFTVNPALTASISPALPIIDNGSSITLRVNATGGLPNYFYQWYTGLACTPGNEISHQTALSYSTGAIGFTSSFSVRVTDSSPGTPAAQHCASVTVSVNPALDPSLALSLSAIDTGQTSTVTATVTWTGGTSPYSVTLDSGTSSTCSSDTTPVAVLSGTNPATGVTGASATFAFRTPAASTEYCAKVTDSASVKVPVYTQVMLFTVNPALTTRGFALSLSVIDTGQTSTVTATVTWTGGTSPYSVTLDSGTSSTCSSDTTVVAVMPDANPQTGLTGNSTTFSFTAPASATYYCAVVGDGSTVSAFVASPSAQLMVNPALTVTISPPSQAVDRGQSYAVTLTGIPSGGTSPYQYQWYTGSTCTSGSAILGQTSSSYSPGVIVTTTTYSVRVTDSSTGTPAAVSCAASTIIVNPTLSAPTLTLSPSTTTTGMTPTVTATVTWSGGAPPYPVTLHSGISSTCAADTTVVGMNAGVVGLSTTFTFTAPSSTTYYCVTVTDSATVPVVVTTPAAVFTVNPALMVTISPGSSTIDSGQSITLSATPSNGVSPYSYQWYAGSTCSVAISGETSPSYVASPLSTSQYSVGVTDSNAPTPNTACSTITVTVNAAFVGTTVTISSSTSIDSGQSVTLTVSWLSAGTPTYTVQLTTSTTTSCSSPASFESQTAISGTSATFTVSPTSSKYYCATVTDSANSPESSSTTAAATVSVFPTLSTPVLALSPFAIDTGQTAAVTATVTWSGGASPYAVVLESGSSSSCASDTTVVAVSGSNPQLGLTGPSTTFSFAFSGSTTYYCAKVTDGATTSVSVTSSSAILAVNSALTSLISPASPKIDHEQSVVLTAVPSSGTPTYFYQWYTGLTCAAGSALSWTSSSYSTGALASDASYSVLVTDSSQGIPGASSCAHVTVTVDPALAVTIDPPSQSIDSGQSITLTAVPSSGTPTYFYQWYSGSGCVGSNALEDYTASSFFTGPLTTTTIFSVNVTDSSIGTPAASVCATVTVTVNAALTAAISPAAPKIDSGQSITLTANPLGGTTPYTYQWYSGSSATCSSDTTKLGTTSTQSVNPTSSTYYCYTVKDASTGTPAASATSATTRVTVSAALATPTISPSSRTIDSGQSITLTVSWSGGTSTYTVKLYGSSTSSCSSASTLISTTSAVSGTSTPFPVSPTTNTYYCATVTDSANSSFTTPASSADLVTVNTALVANAISPSAPKIDSGQSITLTANPLGGTTPYTYQWYSGSSATCSSDTTKLGTTSTQSVNPTSSTYYCYTVTDASTNAPTVSSATDSVTVDPTLTAGAITPSAPTIDSGQSITLTANPLGGTTPYTYQWYSGSSATCSSDTTLLGTAPTQSVNPTSSTYYCYTVKDASTGTPAASATSVTDLVTVNLALTAPVISVSPTSISSGGSSTLSTTTSFSGGTSTYTCQWLFEAPGSSSFSSLGSSFACTTTSTPTVSTGALGTVGVWEFKLEVTDSSTVPSIVTSNVVTVTVS